MAQCSVSLKVPTEKRDAWKAQAVQEGVSFNRWAVVALDERLQLDASDSRRREDEKRQREKLVKVMNPQGQSKCKHVSVGQFCYQCGEKRWK